MSRVMTHAKLLLDQVGHAGRSIAGFIAQALGTLEQQSVQALPIFQAQTWLAPGPPRFAQPRLAPGADTAAPSGLGLDEPP